MSRKNVVFVTLFLLISVGSILFLRHQDRLRREQQQREQLTGSVLAQLSSGIRIGSTRQQVSEYLDTRQIKYFRRSTPFLPLYNDLLPLGRRPSGVWYCGPIQFGVEIDFKPDLASAPELMDGSSGDRVDKIGPYEWADNCM